MKKLIPLILCAMLAACHGEEEPQCEAPKSDRPTTQPVPDCPDARR